MPINRAGLPGMCKLRERYVYLAGGADFTSGLDMRRVDRYDLKHYTWACDTDRRLLLPELNIARSLSSMCAI